MPKRTRPSDFKTDRAYKRSKTTKRRYSRLANSEKATFHKGRLSLGNIPQVEYKYLDIIGSFTLSTINPSQFLDILATLAQGTGVNQRLADRIVLKSIQYKVSSSTTPGNAGPAKCQFAIVLDKQPDAALATFTDIWSSAHPPYQTFLNVDNDDNRFQVLSMDRYQGGFQNNAGVVYGDVWGRIWDGYIPLNLSTKFKTATTNPVTNTLLFTVGSNVVDAMSTTVYYDFRIRYSDM